MEMDLKIISLSVGTIILCMVITTSARCKDWYKSCGAHKLRYGCELERYRSWMKKYCCQSCQVCEDKYKWCQQHKIQCNPGMKYHELAKKGCRKTCGFCGRASCRDKNNSCQNYKAWGYCSMKRTRSFMKRNCAKTCRFCIPDDEINSDSCGYSEAGRIIGGEDARAGDWKWQVSIAFKRKTKNVRCGGTLITNQWVLTARHCFPAKMAEAKIKQRMVVTLGDTDLYKDEGMEIISKISKVVFHKDYSIATGDNDLTLLKLEKPVTFNSFITPACLPTSVQHVKNYVQCYITGWGKLGIKDKKPTVLQQAEVPLVDRNKCHEHMMLNRDISISEKMICAGYGNGGSDTCKGDSGGPLVCTKGSGKSRRFHLVGVTNFGSTKCGSSYGVYARVSKHISWIKDAIKS